MLAEEKEGSDKTVLMSHLFFDLIGIVNLKLINKKNQYHGLNKVKQLMK